MASNENIVLEPTNDQFANKVNIEPDSITLIASEIVDTVINGKDDRLEQLTSANDDNVGGRSLARESGYTRPFKCSQCSRLYRTEERLKLHVTCDHEGGPLKCDQCDKIFKTVSGFKAHSSVHTTTTPYKCTVCDGFFKNKFSLKEHYKIHNGAIFKCQFCAKDFNKIGNLREHESRHAERNFKDHVCKICGRGFEKRYKMKYHMRVHTGDRPFKCSMCDSAFADKSNLQKHYRIHTGEKPFKCDVCDKAFSQNSSLTCHKRTHVTYKPFACKYCGKNFGLHEEMLVHLRVHGEQKMFTCSFCNTEFKEHSYLKSHMRMHTQMVTAAKTVNVCKETLDIYDERNYLKEGEVYVPKPLPIAIPRKRKSRAKPKKPTDDASASAATVAKKHRKTTAEKSPPKKRICRRARKRDTSESSDEILPISKRNSETIENGDRPIKIENEIILKSEEENDDWMPTELLNKVEVSILKNELDESAIVTKDSNMSAKVDIEFNSVIVKSDNDDDYFDENFGFENNYDNLLESSGEEEAFKKSDVSKNNAEEPVVTNFETKVKVETERTPMVLLKRVNVQNELENLIKPKQEDIITIKIEPISIENDDSGDQVKHEGIYIDDVHSKEIDQIGADAKKLGIKRFQCRQCPSSYTRLSTLRYHYAEKHSAKPKKSKFNKQFKCTKCPAAFTRGYILQLHIMKLHGCTFVCEKCNVDCIDYENFKKHKRNCLKKPKMEYLCQFCNKRFRDNPALEFHELGHTGEKPFECDYCAKEFRAKQSLRQHMNLHSGLSPYNCKVCSKDFITKAHLNQHLLQHTDTKPFQCDVCKEYFKSNGRLYNHKKIHREDMYKCTHCGKGFKALGNCQVHELRHLDPSEKKFPCEVCGKAFILKYALRYHMRTHTGERPYPCTICPSRFTEVSNLTKHMRIHTGFKPYKCSICNKEFGQLGSLNSHKKIHITYKPFKCEYCAKDYALSEDLVVHLRVHGDIRMFKCNVCDKEYEQLCNYKSHRRLHFGNEVQNDDRNISIDDWTSMLKESRKITAETIPTHTTLIENLVDNMKKYTAAHNLLKGEPPAAPPHPLNLVAEHNNYYSNIF